MDELTPEQVAALKKRLIELRDEITARLSERGESAPVDLDQPIGRLSRMEAIQSQQMAQARRRRDETQLQVVKAALSRIQQGSYGECLRCEESIGFERLTVSPEATLCRNCRAADERGS